MNARILLSLCLAGVAFVTEARAEDKVAVTWHGKRYDAATLPSDLADTARAAVAEWRAWAHKAEYQMEFDATGRVLLLTAEKSSRAESAMPIVARAETWFDDLLPLTNAMQLQAPSAVPAKSAKTPQKPAAKKTEDIPEDPEGAPPVLAPPKATPGSKTSAAKPEAAATAWGSGSFAPDSRTAVLIAFANEKDQESALAYLSNQHPELASWAAKAGTDLGFVIDNPLIAAFVESASGQEEWSPEHEIVNRLLRLFLLSRFGQMPNWVTHGIAWEAETAFDGSIWVYPYRSEFVYTVEHAAWPLDLAHEFQDRAKKPLQIEELTRWARGTWDGTSARHAFGLVHALAATKKPALSGVLADLRAHREENNKKLADDGTWTRNADWESPPAAQLAILRARAGENVLADVSAWLAKQGGGKAQSVGAR